MKTVIFALMLSLGSFAGDGYHSNDWEDRSECAPEGCLVTESQTIGFRTLSSHYESYKKLNTNSTLPDVLEGKICYQGSAREVIEIVKALASNTDRNYYAGGHASIEHIAMVTEGDAIRVVAKINSDYSDYIINKKINTCK
ncbi:MAG: hypothetical protein KC478_13645 [Bacteriovoracaceae bacterium]|nr:hypothetical protein [Bacteriovoracaceae bacterium]